MQLNVKLPKGRKNNNVKNKTFIKQENQLPANRRSINKGSIKLLQD